jgi:hypothetical protein
MIDSQFHTNRMFLLMQEMFRKTNKYTTINEDKRHSLMITSDFNYQRTFQDKNMR